MRGAMGRGGSRPGAGRPGLGVDLQYAIIMECFEIHEWFRARAKAMAWRAYFARFPSEEHVRDRQQQMQRWSPRERQAALQKERGGELLGDTSRREILEDVRGMLDEKSGPGGRTQRGFHSIRIPRPRARQQIFELTARRVSRRYKTRVSKHTVEKIWKGWESMQKRLKDEGV